MKIKTIVCTLIGPITLGCGVHADYEREGDLSADSADTASSALISREAASSAVTSKGVASSTALIDQSTKVQTAQGVSTIGTALRVRPLDPTFPGGPLVLDPGLAPDPEYPQTNLRILSRSMVPANPSASPAVPPSAQVKLGWQSTGSPQQMFVYRQTWTLGATGTQEFTAGPTTQVAELGAQPNGFVSWTDTAPKFNTRNCYFIKAGDGTYFSYSSIQCVYTQDPERSRPIGRVQIRLKLASPSSAATSSNVRVRLHYGIPGSTATTYTWLDSTSNHYRIAGQEDTYDLLAPDIGDLSDISMIGVEVPGDDSLCIKELELLADNTRAFLKTSPVDACGNGNVFPWAWHSGLIDGTSVNIPFEELRNNATWKNFTPPIFPNTVSATHPNGRSFVGYRKDELIKKLDATVGHSLKENGTPTGDTDRRFRAESTTITRVNDRLIRIQQHLRIKDSTLCTVDAHPVYNLKIVSLDKDGLPFDGSNGPIQSTTLVPELLAQNIDPKGLCSYIPGLNVYAYLQAHFKFGKEFRSIGGTEAGKPPAGVRFCFPGVGAVGVFPGFENGGLSLCFGQD